MRDEDDRLSPGDIPSAIGLATNRYSSDRPVEIVEDVLVIAGDKLDALEFWSIDFSCIVNIETPLDGNPPTYLDQGKYYVYVLPNKTEEHRFTGGAVDLEQVCRVTYTARHAAPDTFAEEDHEIIACLSAAFLCDQLAALYSHDTDSTVQADSVEHGDKGRHFAARAKAYRARYDSKFRKPTTSGAASAVVTHDIRSSTGKKRLFH